MAERSLDVEFEPEAKLVYEPGPGETIGRVDIDLPEDGVIYGDYRGHEITQLSATESFQEQCGNIICGAEVRIDTIGTTYHDGSRKVWAAKVKCIIGDCPLGQSGGGAGDREPRRPLPSLPELHANQSLPVEVET
jgi:hypothetical protein